MPITRDQIKTLTSLYGKMAELEQAKEYVKVSTFAVDLVDEHFIGCGTRSLVKEAIGGRVALSSLIQETLAHRINVLIEEVERAIIAAGGEA